MIQSGTIYEGSHVVIWMVCRTVKAHTFQRSVDCIIGLIAIFCHTIRAHASRRVPWSILHHRNSGVLERKKTSARKGEQGQRTNVRDQRHTSACGGLELAKMEHCRPRRRAVAAFEVLIRTYCDTLSFVVALV